ncbi:P-loop containing nucleoside triphosphate hydrolase protein [Dioscorea alata]|uniref:P-loop containing nucleoside triphosphate hydrolase protein n=1 Tax=Dioscorea alata TaxID=55571 RepID=A0ACB7UZM7_DIOAL|nr:P-loop containing nucleoside triphosphate hydrolase protein [Dioscorea alata]
MKDDYNNRGCLVGSCSLNCWAKCKISQRSIKLLKEINNLKTELDAFKEKTVALPRRIVKEIPTPSIVVGKIIKLNLKKVRGYLADDNVSMVGIWGMGGVGKTTLLTEINNSLLGGDINMGFKYVISLVVSKEPQFEKLQKEISERLGLPSGSKKSDIFEFLKNMDFLILLDDMWKAVDLPDTLGIPLPHHQSQSWEDRGQKYKHKVIFTTREDDVCACMKANKQIKVEFLDGEEAWHLFKQHANEEIINSNAGIKKLAMKVMEKCSGLPLALKVIGRAMSNKKKLEEWRDMLKSLVKLDVKTITGIEESLFNILKLSYDNLADDTLQQCFLCCAQWPEDSFIPTLDLIEYWIGIGLIDDFRNIGEAFDKGYDLIGNLNAACLVELHYRSGRDYVKLHDVILNMALWIVSECGKKKNKWITCTNDGDDLSQSMEWEAEIRVLVNLRYLDISYTRISKFGKGRRIKDGLSILSRLPKLQVLDLSGNNCLEAYDLSLLMGRVKAIGMHVTSVETLGLFKHLPTWNITMQELRHMPILHFCDLSNKHGGEGLMQLTIQDCNFKELLINGSGVSLKHINLSGLAKLKQITWPAETLPIKCFPRTLTIQECSAMVELIDPTDQMQQASSGLPTFPSLQSLSLSLMAKLVSFSTCPLDFPVLSELWLEDCPKLKKLPFKSSIVNNKFKDVYVDKKCWEGLELDKTIRSYLIKFLQTFGWVHG